MTTLHTASYDGRQQNIREMVSPPIEVFQNIYEDRSYRIDFSISEFSAICPKTSLPDYGELLISYRPRAYCLELKSLKEYVLFYRNLGIFQENVANRVKDDLIRACLPSWLRIHLDYNVRGGIKTRVTTLYSISRNTSNRSSSKDSPPL